MSENMFEVAVRGKYRFLFKGLVSVEDLWDLSVTDLDSIFKKLNSEKKQAQEESLLDTRSRKDRELDVKVDIVKYIVATKLAEEDAKLKAKDRREKKQRIMEIIAVKDEESLQNKSKEELMAMLDELDS